MKKDRIFLSFPHLAGNEREWIDSAFEGSWVVPLGPNVDEFEQRLESFLGTGNVVALSAGTAAIHLGLVLSGVEAGDEVICQSFTFSASANPVTYQGAKPIFIDSEADSWNMSPTLLEEAIIDRKAKTGKYPKAIIPVHLYGMPAKMQEILAIAKKYDIAVVEDAAEALGSTLDGKFCGTFGNYGCLSFNGNKIITTSGGGALICPNDECDARAKFLSTQAREAMPYYYHNVVGYNYRLSNISAGIGCGQMTVLADHLARRREIHNFYTQGLRDIPCISVLQNYGPEVNSNFWLTTITFDKSTNFDPEDLRLFLAAENIESRWLWRPMHMQPVFANAPFYGNGVSEDLFSRGLCLPSGSILSNDDVARVIDAIKTYVDTKL